MDMSENERKFFVKHFGEKVASEKLNIEGFAEPIPFDIYDGHAVCEDFNGHRYDMVYPMLKCVKDNEEFSNAVMEYVGGITSADDITPIHVLLTFNTLYEDGKEIVPNN